MMLLQFVRSQQIWSSINVPIVDSILNSIWDGRESSTSAKYCFHLRKFLAYLSDENLSSNLPFQSVTVATYLTKLKMENHSKSSIDCTMASLKWIHSFIPGINHWNNPMKDEFLSKIVSSSKRRVSAVKNQKSPLSGCHIYEIIQSSNLDSLIELRDCLVIALAYCLLLRHDELSHLTLNNFQDCTEGIKIFIPKSKTDKFRNGSNVLLQKSSDPHSPYALLMRYLFQISLNFGDDHFLFFPLKKVKEMNIIQNKILSYASYREIVKNLVSKIGLDPKIYGTHSLRSGGATALAPLATEHELLTSGRWKDSRSIRSYVELSDASRFKMNGLLQSAISAPSQS